MSKIENLISKMTDDYIRNYLEIDNVYLGFEDYYKSNGFILISLVSKKHDEEKCFLAIKTLFHYGVNPNFKDANGNNFIQGALEVGYSEEFILKVSEEALKHGLNVNHVNNEEQTIINSAITSENYTGGVIELSKLLGVHGFNFDSYDFFGNDVIDNLNFYRRTKEIAAMEVIINYFKQLKEKLKASEGENLEVTSFPPAVVKKELDRVLKKHETENKGC